ncbi:MAG: hypothetical protein A3H96_22150 [Acidobacteria bacterium RIFCSPLOWO2_02_FULL_67_36]|nr:MAG: hypothetical protein A3H96_22150 [Acidobacteria bacterium RIFCSPLOWO2_02_FULL_67_36]OFW19895.1 MAG: hypothetical protein A3G21_09745 [Acidobacteria bacterium RIFCSPLOWO2_12_FULL_66_21]
MPTCDVLIVGGGPAGSTCAWALGREGADVIVLDRARFPRDKVCAGWVTPAVFTALELTPSDYGADGRVLQPLHAFRTSVVGGAAVETRYPGPVSYGIRRTEFDAFLLRRSNARVIEGTPLAGLRRDGEAWIANENIRAKLVVGAAGHFCPVARRMRGTVNGGLVVAREAELRMPQGERCAIDGDTAELFFSRDLDGYGWCVRKGGYLNVGIGRRVRDGFDQHVKAFAAFLERSGRVPASAVDWRTWHGHAYLLAGAAPGPPVDDQVLLIGDAAGLAYRESGEGIGPAVESGLMAARAIVNARGRYTKDNLLPYADAVGMKRPADGLGARLRARAPAAIGRALLSTPRVARMVIDRWFLRC